MNILTSVRKKSPTSSGFEADRDANAAINLKKEDLKQLGMA